jgi:hypothetical protein
MFEHEEPGMTVEADAASRKMQFYRAQDAQDMDANPIMSPPRIEKAVWSTMDITPTADGQKVTVLFTGDGPDGFSLVHSWFGCGFVLPRHSHNADCLYYVLTGELRMGARVLGPGEGFFVKSGAPYTYTAGPEGVQILEFRSATSFDMQVFDQTPERWQPILAAALLNRDRWLAEAPAS